MGIMDSIFGGVQRQQPVQNQQQQPQQVAPSQAPGGQNNLANSVVANNPPGTTGPRAASDANLPANGDKKAPLDEFAKIWEPPAADGKVKDLSKFTRPRLDSARLNEGVGKMSFTQGLDPQLVQKALNGDAEAFMQALDHVGRQSFSNSFQAAERYQGQMLDSYDQSVNARIPKEVGRMESRNLLQQANKNLDHPAVMPLLEVVRKQMEQAYPDATPAEIAEASKKYLTQVGGLITSQSESDNGNNQQVRGNNQRKSSTVTDFSNFDAQPQ